jgi:hypothetical protein
MLAATRAQFTRPLSASLGSEMLLALTTVALLAATFAHSIGTYLEKARYAQVLGLSAQVRTYLTIEHAITGRWASAPPPDLVELNNDLALRSVTLVDGNYNFY